MLLFPNAKINLGLNIHRKRENGYHELETVFYPIGLNDGLEFVENKENRINFSSSGLALDVNPEENIIVKAYRILSADYNLSGLDIHLHKVIPFGAGLGGGSSDAAFFLKGLNDHFCLGLSPEILKGYAVRLGADCSFFIENKPAIASGIGEKLQNVDLSLKGYYLVLVKPPSGVGTKEAYSKIRPYVPEIPIAAIITKPIETWQNLLFNDFETSVFQQYPEIEEIKSKLIQIGAVYAAMSGSGSSVFGIFKNEPELKKQFIVSQYFIWKEFLP